MTSGVAMISRFLTGALVAASLFATATSASAAPGNRPAAQSNRPATVAVNPFSNFLALFTGVPRTVVPFQSRYSAGTIVVSTHERRLYLVLGNGQAMRYGVGVGKEGFTWSGTQTVTRKAEWPDWTPPEEMLRRRPDLPRHMRGGPDNPMGARAMYLGDTMYRIHGSNEPHTIGTATSSGCIRMTNDDVIDLYNRVRVGATVVVQR
jgi:lipoprotein-anchoring transpeptidase ErfK/SrfK